MSRIQVLSQGKGSTHADQRHLPHVLLVVDGFPKALGGGERIVLRLATLLPHYGFRASILTFAAHPEGEFRPQESPCPIYLLPLTNTYGIEALRGAIALSTFLSRQEVKIVQTFFESSDIWAGAVTRIFSRAKLVWSRRDMGILRSAKHRLAYRVMRRFPHAVMAVSARVAEHVVTVDGVPAPRVSVVHNGLDLINAPATARDPVQNGSSRHVTTVGNVRRVKGHDLLIEAAGKLIARFPETTFSIAGEVLEPSYFQELQARVAALGLADQFTFRGKISDLPAHLRNADIFVLPSRSEGFSNALIEAMASGIPCVATNVGGNAEAIQDGRSGLIIPPEDVNALSAALKGLLEDALLAKRLGDGGRTAVEESFSVEAMMGKVASIFSALLETRGA